MTINIADFSFSAGGDTFTDLFTLYSEVAAFNATDVDVGNSSEEAAGQESAIVYDSDTDIYYHLRYQKPGRKVIFETHPKMANSRIKNFQLQIIVGQHLAMPWVYHLPTFKHIMMCIREL